MRKFLVTFLRRGARRWGQIRIEGAVLALTTVVRCTVLFQHHSPFKTIYGWMGLSQNESLYYRANKK